MGGVETVPTCLVWQATESGLHDVWCLGARLSI